LRKTTTGVPRWWPKVAPGIQGQLRLQVSLYGSAGLTNTSSLRWIRKSRQESSVLKRGPRLHWQLDGLPRYGRCISVGAVSVDLASASGIPVARRAMLVRPPSVATGPRIHWVPAATRPSFPSNRRRTPQPAIASGPARSPCPQVPRMLSFFAFIRRLYRDAPMRAQQQERESHAGQGEITRFGEVQPPAAGTRSSSRTPLPASGRMPGAGRRMGQRSPRSRQDGARGQFPTSTRASCQRSGITPTVATAIRCCAVIACRRQ
jgi:hypothetical protein